MTVPGPIFILGLPLVVAVGLQLLRRWTAVTAWLGAVTAGLIGTGVVFLPLTQPWQLGSLEIELGEPLLILGRELIVQPVDRFALAFLFFTTAGLFVVAWRLLPHSNFFPIGLVTVALLAGALLVEQVVYTALLVVMAAILAVFPLHEPETMSGRAGTEGHGDGSHTSGGLRYMAYAVLAQALEKPVVYVSEFEVRHSRDSGCEHLGNMDAGTRHRRGNPYTHQKSGGTDPIRHP